jgi:hypothetical protein
MVVYSGPLLQALKVFVEITEGLVGEDPRLLTQYPIPEGGFREPGGNEEVYGKEDDAYQDVPQGQGPSLNEHVDADRQKQNIRGDKARRVNGPLAHFVKAAVHSDPFAGMGDDLQEGEEKHADRNFLGKTSMHTEGDHGQWHPLHADDVEHVREPAHGIAAHIRIGLVLT